MGCRDVLFFFSSRRRHTRFDCDWSSDVCSSDLAVLGNWRVSTVNIYQTGTPVSISTSVSQPIFAGRTVPYVTSYNGWQPNWSGSFEDRKSTRLNSSHSQISYAVFCLKKKTTAYQ